MDQVAIWNVVRTEEEIQASLYQPLTGSEAGLVAAWRADEGGGETLMDSTPNQLNGYVTNGLAWVRSCIPAQGGALAFGGKDDHLRIPAFGAAAPTNEVTVEFWLRLGGIEEQVVFALTPDEPDQRLSASIAGGVGRLVWEFGDPLAGGQLVGESGNTPLGGWQHFALVASTSDNAMRIYRNGQLESWKPGASVLRQRHADLLIGSVAGAVASHQLDEFRVWNVARGQTDIQTNMHRHLRGNEPGLVLYLPFDECAGKAAADVSGSSFVGYLSNGTAWAASPLTFAPDVATTPVSGVGLREATLHGQVNPNGLPGTAWFQWGETTNYGDAVAFDPGIGSSLAPCRVALTGLLPGMTYHYRVAATNSAGLSVGEDQTFLPAVSPVANTQEPTEVKGTFAEASATLHGTVIPNWAPTWAWFEWGPNIPCGNRTTATCVGAGTNEFSLQAELAGLATGVVYHYRLAASNSAGIVFGADRTFTAPGVSLIGPRVMTNFLHAPFTDPGARVTQPIVSVAAGSYHCLALTYDGRVVAWGAGLSSTGFPHVGQASVPSRLRDVIAISAGSMHSLALRRDGTVVAWGRGLQGLGYGEAAVPPGLANVVAIAGGGTFSLALQRDGTLVGWGGSPVGGVDIAPDFHDLVAIAASSFYSAGISRDGTDMMWGFPGGSPPLEMSKDVVAVAAGHNVTMALQPSGRVVVWGGGTDTAVPAGLNNVIAIAAGPSAAHCLALQRDGTVVGWGGYIGPPPPGLSNVIAVAGGGNTSLALCSGGTVLGWGASDYGQTNPPPKLAESARPVAVSGSVNTNIPGSYTLSYTATNAQGIIATATRVVIVAVPEVVNLSARVNADRLVLEFLTRPAGRYAVEVSTNLYDWITLATGLTGTNGWGQFEDPAVGTFRSRFYRVVSQ